MKCNICYIHKLLWNNTWKSWLLILRSEVGYTDKSILYRKTHKKICVTAVYTFYKAWCVQQKKKKSARGAREALSAALNKDTCKYS